MNYYWTKNASKNTKKKFKNNNHVLDLFSIEHNNQK